MRGKIIALGAESVISRIEAWGLSLVEKTRLKKPYLLQDIDNTLRNSRLNREGRMLTVARSLGILTPSVYAINYESKSILMDYIDGSQLKVILPDATENRIRMFCEAFGEMLAKLHHDGIVHGDPTTSNLLVDNNQRLWMIDFGLAEMNASIEMKGVDLHLVRRALETTHWDIQDTLLNAVLKGYKKFLGAPANEVLERMSEIRERGRYH